MDIKFETLYKYAERKYLKKSTFLWRPRAKSKLVQFNTNSWDPKGFNIYYVWWLGSFLGSP